MKRNDFAINICFSYSPGNQLGILGSKIKDQNLFCHSANIVFTSKFDVWLIGLKALIPNIYIYKN